MILHMYVDSNYFFSVYCEIACVFLKRDLNPLKQVRIGSEEHICPTERTEGVSGPLREEFTPC
jgi:hypothetical protein